MSRKQPLTHEEFRSIYSRVPRITIDLIVKSPEGILLTLRNSDGWIGQWHLPGGTIYLGEEVEAALQRIAREELGIEIGDHSLVGFIEYSEVAERGFGHSISLAFICNPKSTNIKIDEMASEYNFFQTPPENTITEQKKFISNYIK